MVASYINKGDLFVITKADEEVGAILFVKHNHHTIELKNIIINQTNRGRGYGKAVINELTPFYQQQGYRCMAVGTANSSIDNIAFYQKAGFRLTTIKRDFFQQYAQPIYEHGIRARDLLWFEKLL
ncbi:Acetyltransferase (GNAT) domain-containing protein [Amphibacillus marinus]|uniref:Acetyltransferase (GNAT) domain-containing protein n=1 Tax=Amphibacillus marinus TaxID=872970 RepID=A0A1H8QSZ8_9BACI|nr:GNAT family N-acetyltransferase [Amphibacillus marinus]SEO57419.1 Acetyltransferase (GNAT) domain-containing protein [Amphibacillus marinus]